MAEDGIIITDTLVIPDWEVQEQFIRGSGPGGQNVNKVATAVKLRWNVAASSLPASVKGRFKRRFGSRLTKDGDLILDVREHRTQALNREAARKRLADMVRAVATPPKRRIATRPTKGSVRRRLDSKKRRGDVKSLRGKVQADD